MTLLTVGTFDLLHLGHLNLLSRCREITPDVIVGLNSDEFVKTYKGSSPILNYSERAKTLEYLGFPVLKNSSAGQHLISEVKPDILAIGTDWARKDYLKQIDVTQDWLDENNISLIYIPYYQGLSSTEIKRRVLGNSNST